jgi:hypothetical protein
MKKFTDLSCLISVVIVVFSTICLAEAERDPNALPSGEALLSPVGTFAETTQFVVSVSDDIMCGVSKWRLKTFSKNNIEDVISSHWLPYSSPRIFEYYEGYIYLVQGYEGIWIFDLNNPERIRLAGVLDVSVSYHAQIEIKEDKLFLVNSYPAELLIFSLENPEEPQEISRCRLPESMGSGYKVRLVDDKIYILCYYGLVICDAQDVINPEVLSVIHIESNYSLGAFIINGSYAYIYTGGEIRIFDISNLEAVGQPIIIEANWCSHAVLRKNHFIGFGRNGVYIYDLSSPLSPELVRYHYNDMPGDFLIGKSQDYMVDNDGKVEPLEGLPYFSGAISRFGFRADNIVFRDEYAYLFGSGRLWVLDISSPWVPQYITDISASSVPRDTVIIDSNNIYTPRQIIDISQPSEPSVVKSFFGGSHGGVAVKDNYLLLVKLESLEIWDNTTPAEATWKKSIFFEERLNKIIVHDDIIYLGFSGGKLCSCRLEDDLTLTTLGQIELAATEWGFIMDLCIEGDLLYVALNKDGIASVDISDPYYMDIYARFNTSQYSEQIKVLDAYAYVADGSGGILVIDMLTKGYEKKIASYQSPDWTFAVAISGSYVYSCNSDSGVTIFFSNLLNPE